MSSLYLKSYFLATTCGLYFPEGIFKISSLFISFIVSPEQCPLVFSSSHPLNIKFILMGRKQQEKLVCCLGLRKTIHLDQRLRVKHQRENIPLFFVTSGFLHCFCGWIKRPLCVFMYIAQLLPLSFEVYGYSINFKWKGALHSFVFPF